MSAEQDSTNSISGWISSKSSDIWFDPSFFVRTRIIGTLLLRKLRTSEIHYGKILLEKNFENSNRVKISQFLDNEENEVGRIALGH